MEKEKGMTLREVLQIDELKDVKVIAGEEGLDRLVKNVNVMEVPDIQKWIKEGQLLLTAGFSIKDDVIAQKNLIPKLAKKGLAGLMIKPKRYIEEIPDSMIEAANKNKFPLLEMPQDLSHPLILEIIYEKLVNRQASILKKLDNAHQKILNEVVKGGGLKDISETLFELIDNPAAIITNNNKIYLGLEIDKSFTAEFKDFLSRLIEEENRFISKNKYRGKVEFADKDLDAISVPILVGNSYYGNIFVLESKHKMKKSDIMIIERSSIIAALSIINKKSIQEVERRYKNEFLFDWIEGNFYSKKLLIQRGKILGWDLRHSFLPIVISIDNYNHLLNDSQGSYKAKSIKENLQRKIRNICSDLNEVFICGDEGDSILLLIKISNKEESESEIKDKAKQIAKKIQKNFSKEQDHSCSIGIGRFRADLLEVPESYQEAKKSIKITRKFYGKGNTSHFDDLGVYRILYNTKEKEMEKFVHDYYNPLSEYDKNQDTELVKTAKMFFQCKGNVSEMAKKLYTHYNTIRYRLNRIEEITNISLNDAEEQLNLQLAIKIGETEEYQ